MMVDNLSEKEMCGILVINKSSGMTSHDVVANVRRFLCAKTGHTGTLDPFATGVLPLCVGRATLLSRFIMEGDKVYEGTICLGMTSDTLDRTGKITKLSDSVDDISIEKIKAALDSFKGVFFQKPPIYSALKYKGKALYKWAREGKPVEKPPRRVIIHNLELLGVDLPYIFIRVECSKGVYIRSLASDIGNILGCGGLLYELKRMSSGHCDISDAITLDDLLEMDKDSVSARMISIEKSLKDIPAYLVTDKMVERIRHGQLIKAVEINLPVELPDVFRLISSNNLTISLMAPPVDKMGFLKYLRVIMPSITYN